MDFAQTGQSGPGVFRRSGASEDPLPRRDRRGGPAQLRSVQRRTVASALPVGRRLLALSGRERQTRRKVAPLHGRNSSSRWSLLLLFYHYITLSIRIQFNL